MNTLKVLRARRWTSLCTIIGVLLASRLAGAQANVPTTVQPPPRIVRSSGAQPNSADRSDVDPTSAHDGAGAKNALLDAIAENRGLGPPGTPSVSDVGPDSVTQRVFLEAQHSYYRKLIADYAYTTSVYSWQLHSSQVIFVLVIALVLAGLWLSWIQFKLDIAERRKIRIIEPKKTDQASESDAIAPRDPAQASTFKFGTQGFEVSSSVLGVIILTISLAFFYLYLVYVYPISQIK